jgi:hypothetical protein
MLGVPRWLLDKILPGSAELSGFASRQLPFDKQATFTAGWLGQALAAQIDRVEAEMTEQDEHDEHSAPALLFALRELAADCDLRPAVCRLEEVLLDDGETPERRLLARATSEILASELIDPGPGAPIRHLPTAS